MGAVPGGLTLTTFCTGRTSTSRLDVGGRVAAFRSFAMLKLCTTSAGPRGRASRPPTSTTTVEPGSYSRRIGYPVRRSVGGSAVRQQLDIRSGDEAVARQCSTRVRSLPLSAVQLRASGTS